MILTEYSPFPNCTPSTSTKSPAFHLLGTNSITFQISIVIIILVKFAFFTLTLIPKQLVSLAHRYPIIHSKLDFCNSLRHKLSKSQINGL